MDSFNAELKDFELMEVIGKGSYALVRKVKHIETGKIYAMKILEKSRITGEKLFKGIVFIHFPASFFF